MSKEDWMLECIGELVRSGMPAESAVIAFRKEIGDVEHVDETTDPISAALAIIVHQR